MRSRRALQQIPDEGSADAEAHHQEFLDAQMIHQAEMVVRVGVPRPVDLKRARRLAAIGVARVQRDAAISVLELLHRIERRRGGEERHGRVQSTAWKDQQRKAATCLLIVDADVAFFIESAWRFFSLAAACVARGRARLKRRSRARPRRWPRATIWCRSFERKSGRRFHDKNAVRRQIHPSDRRGRLGVSPIRARARAWSALRHRWRGTLSSSRNIDGPDRHR